MEFSSNSQTKLTQMTETETMSSEMTETLSSISKICSNIRNALNQENSLDIMDDLKMLFQIIQKNNPTFVLNINYEIFIDVFVFLRNVLKCKIPYVDSKNNLTTITLNTIIDLISEKHYHQGVPVSNNIHVVFKKNCQQINCTYHLESLIEHLIMAMCISVAQASQSNESIESIKLIALTALLHDIGKPSCITQYSKLMGYPFHGEYGSGILSQFYSDEIAKFISIDDYEVMCRTISVHMCSYHTTTEDDWAMERRTIAQLEKSSVKHLLNYLSYGDTFGKVSAEKDTDDFIKSRENYNKHIEKQFDVETYMKEKKKETFCIFLRGMSGSGKTFYSKKFIDYLVSMGINEEQIIFVSRDEIMAEITAGKMSRTLSSKRPEGPEYKELYEHYKQQKYGKLVNDEMKNIISSAIIQKKIVIIDSCILMYRGIKDCIPENISNAFIIAIDCIRNTVFTQHDAQKNGSTYENICKSLESRTPIKWISTQDICIETMASYTTTKTKTNNQYIPHLTFQNGFNSEYTIGFNIFTKTIESIIKYFSMNTAIIDTTKMNIIEYVNHLYSTNSYNLENVFSILSSQGYRCTNSHKNNKIMRMNYFDHNRRWIDNWARQTRGITFIVINDMLVPIKYLLQRGAEMMTGMQISNGITETESFDISSIEHLDQIQQETITKLLTNQKIDMTLSFKKDGSLLGYTIYTSPEVIKFMRDFIMQSNDKFAQKILSICDSLSIPFGVFSSQSTLLIGEDMQDWTVQALLSTIMDDEQIQNEFKNKSYFQAIDKYFPEIILKLNYLITRVNAEKKFPSNSSITLTMETICKNRRSVFSNRDHSELALQYQKSSLTVLGISYCDQYNVKNYPHFTFSKYINKYKFIEPMFWTVNHTNEINHLLDDLNKVIFEKMTEHEFFENNIPNNNFSNYEFIVDKEGFVTYTGETYDYGKIKTDAYYIAHKLKSKNVEYLMNLAKIPSARVSFPLSNEVYTFYSKIETDTTTIYNKFVEMCQNTNSILFESLSEKAKISFPKHPQTVQFKMLINSGDGFKKVGLDLFSSVYPFNSDNIDNEFNNDAICCTRNLIMGFINKTINFNEPTKNPEFANLFCVVRKAIQSLN
jgi:hypothetical protein